MAKMSERSKRRGAAMVEAAIVFPLLVLLTLALIEYGWLFINIQNTTSATRHGARMAVTPDETSAEVIAAVKAMMDRTRMGDTGYTISIVPSDVSSVDRGDTIKVTVTVPYGSLNLTGMPLPLPENLQATVSMAKEGP